MVEIVPFPKIKDYDRSVYERFSGGNGGSPTDPGIEARIAKLEAIAEHSKENITEIKGDLRHLLAAVIGSFLLLGGMLIFGYFRLSDQIDSLKLPPPPPPSASGQPAP